MFIACNKNVSSFHTISNSLASHISHSLSSHESKISRRVIRNRGLGLRCHPRRSRIICVLGLVAVARYAWIPRILGRVTGSSAPQTQANKGLKKKIIIPRVTFSGKFFGCAICLAEFVAGDELRVLPKCGHGFHVECIDTWLGSHSTCPSCRRILMVSGCKKCGEVPAADTVPGAEKESRTVGQREDQIDRFLPEGLLNLVCFLNF